ncbi:hypothetical protein [Salmonirosea aquatica]|uniref:Glycosyltransferase RgtA/B/C/D-like domain-containing protein n=1 Tax=Salmonirosea aquatica TaxID=2654236 RepID=A0A7C9F6I1_9BACT|nr:hypothetical protein [Cytophagaceae bacterium SJW1-29]
MAVKNSFFQDLPSRKLIATAGAVFIFALVYIYKNQFHFEIYQDEIHYYATALRFSEQPIPSVELLKTFNELNTPLPFILGGWVVNLLGDDIRYLRLLNFLLSFIIILLFIWSSPNHSRRFWLCLFGLLVFPNYYLCSVHYYTDIIPMLAVLLGVIMYLKKQHWVACLYFIAAICSRQYALAFPAAIFLYECYLVYNQAENSKSAILKALGHATLYPYALACLSLLPWMLLWGGAAPAEEMRRQQYNTAVLYNGGFVLYASAILAFYYLLLETAFTRSWNYYTDYPRRYPKLFIGLVLLVLMLVFFFPARQTHNSYFDWPYLGYFDRLLEIMGITGIFKQLVFGSLMLATLMRFLSPAMSLTGFVVVVNLLLLGKAQLSWDKYIMPTIMVLWFLALFDQYWSLGTYRLHDQKTDSPA